MQQPAKDATIRLSISESARLFGIHEKSLRRAIKNGQVRYIVVRGRYKLLFESVLLWSQRSTQLRTKRDRDGIGQWVEQWKIRNVLYSPRGPRERS